MPEQYRALFYILVLATLVFAFIKKPITATAMTVQDFVRRRNAWYAITIIGFLSPGFWLFVLALSIYLLFAIKREHNPVAFFFFVFLALPQILVRIPGFAGIESFIAIDYVRILSFFVLLPACISLRSETRQQPGGWTPPDILLVMYLSLSFLLQALEATFTESLRNLIYVFIDVLIPYYAVSRSLKNLKIFRDVIASLVIAIMVLSLIGVFEILRNWLPYTSLQMAWGERWDLGGYLGRAGLLRSAGSTGQAIVMGYVIAIGFGFYLYLRRNISSWIASSAGLALLVAGEISPLSKGPWLGAVAMLAVFVSTGPKRFSHLGKMALAAPFLFLFLMSTEVGQSITGFLPFIGKVDESSQEYRTRLFDTAVVIILDNPYFGSTDFLLRMENMRQGQGIIDLVNTYLIVALTSGLIGLAIFCGIFIFVIWGIVRVMFRLPSTTELFVIGQALLAVLIGILLIITTCSFIAQIPLLYWSVAAMGVAYHTIVIKVTTDSTTSTQDATRTSNTSIAPTRHAWIRK